MREDLQQDSFQAVFQPGVQPAPDSMVQVQAKRRSGTGHTAKAAITLGDPEAKQAQRTSSPQRTSSRVPEGPCVKARGEAWRHHVANRVYRIQAEGWDHGRIAPASKWAVVAGLAEPAEATADVPICGNVVGW